MKRQWVNVLGMRLQRWVNKSCVAHFGVGHDSLNGSWATLYGINSKEEGKGHATSLLKAAKNYYEKQGRKVGGTVALNEGMRRIYQKLKITEYLDEQ